MNFVFIPIYYVNNVMRRSILGVNKNGKICPPTVAMSTIYLKENPPPKAYKTDKQRELMQFLFLVCKVDTHFLPRLAKSDWYFSLNDHSTDLLVGAWKGFRHRSDEHCQKSQFLLPNFNLLLVNRNEKGGKPIARKFPIFFCS